MDFKFESTLSKFLDYSLKPGIDPSDPTLDPKKAQAMIIYKDLAEFSDLVEEKLLKKLLDDIGFILGKGWAKEISEKDFNHGHICGKSKVPILNLNDLLSPDNTVILYHTLEHSPFSPDHINRNIESTLISQPIVAHPKYKFGTLPKYTADCSDLGLMGYAMIRFKEKPDGPYMLKNGKKIDLWVVFDKFSLDPYLQK